MITEDYVNFEVAKLLKEKGFEGYSILTIYDEDAANAYIKGLKEKHLPYNSDDPKLKEFHYTIPTLQMAMKWLREVHKLSVRPRYDEVEDEKEHLYYVWFFDILSMNPYKTLVEPVQGYETYEAACEAAIKYCLEKLI